MGDEKISVPNSILKSVFISKCALFISEWEIKHSLAYMPSQSSNRVYSIETYLILSDLVLLKFIWQKHFFVKGLDCSRKKSPQINLSPKWNFLAYITSNNSWWVHRMERLQGLRLGTKQSLFSSIFLSRFCVSFWPLTSFSPSVDNPVTGPSSKEGNNLRWKGNIDFYTFIWMLIFQNVLVPV